MNQTSHQRFVTAVASAWMLALAGGAAAQTYNAVLIPLLPGTTTSAALGVNDAGDVVGWCRAAPNTYRAFLYERATNTTTDIGLLGGATSTLEIGAHSINDDGEVVGVFSAGGLIRAFHWSETTGFADISFFPESNPPYNSGALSIGNNGHIGGLNSFRCASNPTFSVNAGALWPSATEEPASIFGTPFPCGVAGLVHGVNAAGSACGENLTTANGASWTRPIVLGVGGTASFLPTFSGLAENGHAYDISDNGWVCGDAENRSGTITSTACIWSSGGQLTNLGGAPLGRALAVNDSLVVVGWTSGPGTKQGAIWRNIVPGQPQTNGIDLNTILSAPLPQGVFITSAEDISETGFIAVRLSENTASARAALLVPVPPPCTADFNSDGAVNTADLVTFLARFGQTVTPGGPGDLNNDGVVNVLDLTIFLGQFGRTCP